MTNNASTTTARGVLRFAVSGHRRATSGAAVLLAGHQAAEAGVPVLIGVVIDRAVATGAAQSLIGLLGALALLFVALSLAFRFGARLSQRAVLSAEHELRLLVVDGTLDPPGAAHPDLLPGAQLSLATSDARRVASLNSTIAATVAAVAALAVAAAVLLSTSLPLGLLVLVGLPPLLVVLHLLAAPLERRSDREQAAAAHASGTATDLLSGLRVLKGLGAETEATVRYQRASQDALGATLRSAVAQAAYNAAALVLTGLFLTVVALVGGRLAARGSISIGELIAALGLSQFLIGPMTRLGGLSASLARARASAARIAASLPTASGPARTGKLAQPVAGAVQLAGLTRGSLQGLDLAIERGELVGIAIADPADATALLAALTSDHDLEPGSVTLDGVDIATIAPQALRAALLVVPHDADLFSGSLLDNLRTGPTHESELAPVLTATTVDEVASTLPAGMESEVGERGRMLSGGQRQRVALARALAADAPVLVLHDPTSAVDSVTEARIATGLRSFRAGKTSLLVTTSPAILATCDRVVLIDHGRAMAEGTHTTLSQTVARYREIVFA